jgi:cysteine desulfurase
MTSRFGNAHSVDHLLGEEAAALIDEARDAVARLVGADQEQVRFTSGATEAIRIALGIAAAKAPNGVLRAAVSGVEHRAVLDGLHALAIEGRARIHWIGVDGQGRISLDEIASVLSDGVDLMCLMAANNEVGTLYPVQEAAILAHNASAEILVDATQAAGRIDLDADGWAIDYLVLSAHKLYGPKGVGALVSPDACGSLADKVFGHAGTPNVPGAVGFGEACRIAVEEGPGNEARVARLRDRLQCLLQEAVPGLVINGDTTQRLSHNLHVSAPGAPNDVVVSRLRRRVAIATGAACTSGAQEPSHVLRAMGLEGSLQDSALRISPGWFNTLDEIEEAGAAIADAISSVRSTVGGIG